MTLRALIRPLVRDPLRLPLERRGGWMPRFLFAAGEQGGWWDPSDFSTMFQDSAGTTPVTAVGQPVGKILDKSGRGNHRTQATAGSRPTLQQDGSGFYHLLYDGVGTSMATAAVDFTATAKLTALMGLTRLSDAATALAWEIGTSTSVNNGSANLLAPRAAENSFTSTVMGTTSTCTCTSITTAAPFSAVVTQALDVSAGVNTSQNLMRINGVVSGTPGTASTATTAFGNYAIFFGRRGGTTLPFNGREYQTVIRGAVSTATQIAQAERFIGSRMGIAL